MKSVGTFNVIWNILRPFDNVVVIWYILPRLGKFEYLGNLE
jgi:hypothetical protein